MPTLVSWCASHIAEPTQLPLLRRMLESVKAQTHPTPLHISISWNEGWGVSRESVEEVLGAFNFVVPYYRAERLTQFQHYGELLKDWKGDRKQTFILFTDDDDVWPAHRSDVYWESIQVKPNVPFHHASKVLMVKEKTNNWIDFKCMEYWTFSCAVEVFAEMFEIYLKEKAHVPTCDLHFYNIALLHPPACCKVFDYDQPCYEYHVRRPFLFGDSSIDTSSDIGLARCARWVAFCIDFLKRGDAGGNRDRRVGEKKYIETLV